MKAILQFQTRQRDVTSIPDVTGFVAGRFGLSRQRGMQPNESGHVGDLVRTAAFGVGRLLAAKDGVARVRYFTGPSKSPYTEREHDVSAVAPAVLSPHTRVYLHDGQRWRIGRIDGTADEHKRYAIAFPNLEGTHLGVDAFEVRWNVAVEDPFLILESLGGDSPIVYESRLGFLREWARQRAAAVGVEGLLLASVELHHQLAVVRRVAGDPIKRYLLADEVGLGKTIEAAALIWRFLAKNRTGRVLVLVPEYLRHQWAVELLERFRTGRFQDASVRIRSLADDSRWSSDPVDLPLSTKRIASRATAPLTAGVRQRVVDIAHAADEPCCYRRRREIQRSRFSRLAAPIGSSALSSGPSRCLHPPSRRPRQARPDMPGARG